MVLDLTSVQAKRYGVLSCEMQDTLGEATRVMVTEDVSTLVVVDEHGFLAGVITRTDMIRAFLRSENWRRELVQAYMQSDVITVMEHTRLQAVAEILIERHIHRVVVVRMENERPRPVGVISAADLLYHMNK